MDSVRTPVTSSVSLDPQYHGWVLILVSAICIPLLLIFVLLRSYVRVWTPRSFALDDGKNIHLYIRVVCLSKLAACLLATIGTISYAAVFLSCGFYNLAQAKSMAKSRTAVNIAGRPIRSLPIATFNTRFFQELVFVYEMLYGPTVFFAKLSLLLLYLRIFSPDRWTRLFIYFGIGVIFIVYTVTASILVGLCIPRKGESWALGLLSSRCRDTMAMTYVQGIFNIISDFYVLVLPLPVVWKLQLPLRKKVAVSAVFMTGLLACGASSLGLYYRIMLSKDFDWTRHEIGLGSTVVLEMTLGIICGCMPYLAPMLKRWYLRLSQLSVLKNIMSRITSPLRRRSPGSSGFSEIESRPPNNHYLETNILRSVKGEGNFLDSQFCAEKVA